MIGLAFYFGTRLFGHVGLLNDWPPLFAAGAPVLIASVAALLLLRRAEKR